MKIAISLITIFFVGSVFADYDVRINQLPKESIHFKLISIEEPIPEPEPEPECLSMSYNNPYSYWYDYGNTSTSDPNYGTLVYWKGIRVAQNKLGSLQPKVNSFISDGYRYTSNNILGKTTTFSNVSYKGFVYGVCRVPIN